MAKDKILKPQHNKFAEHYAEHGNATLAYMFAFPNTTYASARVLGSNLLTNLNIQDIIEHKKQEFNSQYMLSKEQTVRDLIDSAEEAKQFGQFAAYAKIREMVIKIQGLYPDPKLDITSGGEKININLNLGD